MKRVPLNQGDKINLNNREYTIDTVIGDGATCIVYSAYYEDNLGLPHHVNIKECYPYNADVIREGETLVWMSENERIQKQLSFTTTYKKLMNNQKGNYIVHAFDIGRCNETLYIVMDANDGVTFDNDNANNLSDILTTVKLLAYVVGEYHKNGYLHLDIKPSNFLVYPRPSDHIILFDMDTITPIEDIKSGKVQVCSYSDDWAAPEQKQGKINKLCPATDIYAIGAVLFEKVMGRQVECGDSCLFAEWEFDGDLFEDVNPKIKRLLSNIFRKTISANIKCRYQSANDLIKALAEVIKIANSDIYLKGDDICCSGCFFGRENELNLIKSYFDSKKKAVFLHGFGGIGKTEIARRYAQLNSKKYDNVLFIKYNGNDTLQELLNDIDIVNFDTDDSKEKWRKLRNLLDEHTLVIVDNFDIELGADNGLKSLFETKANILVATRTDFSSVYNGDKYGYIEVKELANSELEQMFITNAKITSITVEDRCILKKIFKLIENHTYATELLAKQMWYSGWSVEELYQKVKSGFASLENAENIDVSKDEKHNDEDNSLNILRAVYNISDLTEGQKQALRDMVLLDHVQITRANYREIALMPRNAYRTKRTLNTIETYEIQLADDIYAKMPDTSLNSFNQLVKLGLILDDGKHFTLHSIIKELALLELKPTLNNCPTIYNYILNMVEWFDEEYEVSDAAQVEANHKAAFLTKLFNRLDLISEDTLHLVLDWLEKFYNDLYFSAYAFNKELELLSLFHRIEIAIKNSSNKGLQFKAYHTLLQVWLQECQASYLIESVSTIKHDLCKKNVEKYFKLSLEIAKELDLADVEQCVYADVSKAIADSRPKREFAREIYDDILSSITTSRGNIPNHVIQEAYAAAPELLQMDAWEKEFYNLPLTNEEQMELEEFRKPKMRSNTQDDRWSDEIERVLLLYRKAENKEDFACDIYNSSNYSSEQKAILFDEFLTASFSPLLFARIKEHSRDAINATDWNQVENILCMWCSILNNYEKWNKSDIYDDYCSWQMYILIYKTIISIMFDRNDLFKYIEKLVDFDTTDSYTLLFDTSFGIAVSMIVSACWAMDKNRYSLPFMKKELDFYLSDDSNIENQWIENHFKMIENIADAAFCASIETQDEPKQHDEFLKIYHWATKLLDRATNKTFDLKPDTEE